MAIWLFSSTDLENIRVGYERLLWGFWDREAGEKQRRNRSRLLGLTTGLSPSTSLYFKSPRLARSTPSG